MTFAETDSPIRPDYLLQAYARHATLAGPRPAELDQWPGGPPRSVEDITAARNIDAMVASLSKPAPPAESTAFASASEAADAGRGLVQRLRATLDGLNGLRLAVEAGPGVGAARIAGAKAVLGNADALIGGLVAGAAARFELSGVLVEPRADGLALGAFALTFRGAGFAVRIGSSAEPFVAADGGEFRPYRAGNALTPPPTASAASMRSRAQP